MNYNQELANKLGNELFELWNECSIRCNRIEQLIKEINEKKKTN